MIQQMTSLRFMDKHMDKGSIEGLYRSENVPQAIVISSVVIQLQYIAPIFTMNSIKMTNQ